MCHFGHILLHEHNVSTDLKIKQIYEIINKLTPKDHSSAKLKYIYVFDVTESEFEKLFTTKTSFIK